MQYQEGYICSMKKESVYYERVTSAIQREGVLGDGRKYEVQQSHICEERVSSTRRDTPAV